MERNERYTRLLQRETMLAVGCTEPIAIALACSKARETLPFLGGDPDQIELVLSRNIIKNALGVGIPGTTMTGIPIAAALGYSGGDSTLGLEVIASVSKEDIARATGYVQRNLITIAQSDSPENLYIEATIHQGGHRSTVVIKHTHTKVERIELDGKVLFENCVEEQVKDEDDLTTASLLDIYQFALETDLVPLKFLLEGARINKQVALEGLSGTYGLQVGKSMQRNVDNHILTDNIIIYGVKLAAAAADARMGGCMLPVFTNSGSGNQGITVSLPVLATAEKVGADEQTIHRALVMSNLVAIHARKGMNRLTAMCGAFTAGIGAASAITFLLGGSILHIYRAVQNMVASLTGMVCDGAKDGCALKIASAVDAAFRSALLAIGDLSISGDKGINEEDVEKSLRNLVRIGNSGMLDTDRIILDIMTSKVGSRA
ncbi:serine dehydratase subunit alpha family protein [Treponema parvum]|uniref:UPF0597 protein HRQ91_07045 n=1 Tax=Treponema parvum TaxID=138851 RepID=A0A975F4R9_9SPIR|nr:L-serine ammonia-lyase, iron-sulfur-dependent, subunit alpha [Treponema parvum]QTQ14223.1 serine dehydratase subunit alpha family protein [Treponema parvum]